jgi:hypothetical protein
MSSGIVDVDIGWTAVTVTGAGARTRVFIEEIEEIVEENL